MCRLKLLNINGQRAGKTCLEYLNLNNNNFDRKNAFKNAF